MPRARVNSVDDRDEFDGPQVHQGVGWITGRLDRDDQCPFIRDLEFTDSSLAEVVPPTRPLGDGLDDLVSGSEGEGNPRAIGITGVFDGHLVGAGLDFRLLRESKTSSLSDGDCTTTSAYTRQDLDWKAEDKLEKEVDGSTIVKDEKDFDSQTYCPATLIHLDPFGCVVPYLDGAISALDVRRIRKKHILHGSPTR